jgi:hypothetical protein
MADPDREDGLRAARNAPQPPLQARLSRWLSLFPVAVVALAILVAVVGRVAEARRMASKAFGVDLVFVTHPTCPDCRTLLGAVTQTPGMRVLDWSAESDRQALRRLRKGDRSPVVAKSIGLPMLLACTADGRCREWVGAPNVRRALVGMGVWADEPFPIVQFGLAAGALMVGIVFARRLRPAAGLLVLVAAFGAVGKLGSTCATCSGTGMAATVGTVAAGLGACLLLWFLVGRRSGSRSAELLTPLVLAALLAGQLAMIVEDPTFCAGCAVFLVGLAATAGCLAVPSSSSGTRTESRLLRNALRVGFAAAICSFGILATVSISAASTERSPFGPVDDSAQARRDLGRLLGRPTTDFLRVSGRPVSVPSAVLVIGTPGCPPCEDAYSWLKTGIQAQVVFVRPLADTRNLRLLIPYPRRTAETEYRCVFKLRTSPVIVVTDRTGRVTWGRTHWPTDAEAAALVVSDVARRMPK